MQQEAVRIVVETEDETETLWATPLGEARFRLENSPMLAYGLSWLDVVEAVPLGDGTLRFVEALEKSGHRTLRIRIGRLPVAERARLLAELRGMGCSFEGEEGRLLAIDVPPGIPLEQATGFLVGTEVEWEYADPPLETLFPSCVR